MGMLLIAIFGTDFELATLRPKQGHHETHDRRLAHIWNQHQRSTTALKQKRKM